MKNSKLISTLLAVVIIAGITVVAPVSTSAASAWKTAYINYVNQVSSKTAEWGWFWLTDLDKNGVPELIWNSGYGLGEGTVSTYQNNKMSNISFSCDGEVMLQNGAVYISSGRQGGLFDSVYKYDGDAILLFLGRKTARSTDFSIVNDENFIFEYKLGAEQDFQTTNFDEYNSKLNSIFDVSKGGKLSSQNCYNVSGIKTAITNYVDSLSAPTVSLSNKANGIYANWNKVANAGKYIVYYKKSNDSGWKSFETTNTNCTLQSVASGGLYYVQVQGVAANGVKGSFSKVKAMTFIGQPTITSLTYNGKNTLKWNAVGGANKYQIARLKTGDKSYTYFTSNTNSFSETASGGIAYTYQVRAMYATANSGTAYGAWSSGKSVGTLVAPTVTLSSQSNAVFAKWNSIKGAVKYIVYFKTAAAKNWKSATVTGTSIPITGTVSGTTYYVQVRPIGSAVSGPYSAAKSITYVTTAKPTVKLSNKSNGIRAEWNSFRDATGYNVFYKTPSASSWTRVTTSNSYYPLLNLRSGTRYYVQVQPIFGNYKGAYSTVNSLVYSPVTSNNSTSVSSSYVLNVNSRVFHKSNCPSVSRMNESNKYYYNGTRQEIINMGYSPCQNCNP